jgi:hypothetical protein
MNILRTSLYSEKLGRSLPIFISPFFVGVVLTTRRVGTPRKRVMPSSVTRARGPDIISSIGTGHQNRRMNL